MSAELLDELTLQRSRSTRLAPDDYVFCKKNSKPYSDQWVRFKILYPALDRADIERKPYAFGFHLFRHSATTIVDEKTKGLREAADLMGHAFESTTAGYSHREQKVARGSEIIAETIFPNRGLVVAQKSGVVH